jgi:hypothetical protein
MPCDGLCKDCGWTFGHLHAFLFCLFLSLRLVRERRKGWSAGIMRLWYESFTGLQCVVLMYKCSLYG